MNNRVFFDIYVDQLFDPAKWEIISFHNEAGRRLAASTVPNDPQVLLPVGDRLTNQAANVRREENISFVQVKASINLSAITNLLSSVYTIDTFIELPTEDKLILDGTGTDRTVHTFVGRSDIRTYTALEFKTAVLNITHQLKPAFPPNSTSQIS